MSPRSHRFEPFRMLCMFGLLALSIGAGAESKKRHAAVLARVLSYENSLDERVGAMIGIAVVYKKGDALSEANADDWMLALEEQSAQLKINNHPFFVKKVIFGQEALASAIDKDGVDVFLACDGLASDLDVIVRLARSKHVLTMANSVSYLQSGMTLCIVEEDGKLKIVVNITTAPLEGVKFSSKMLKLATVIR